MDQNINWHRLSSEEAVKQLDAAATGLDSANAAARLAKYGRNELQGKKERSRLNIFLGQFMDVMILILAVAAVISFAVGEATDAYVVLAIIIGNAVLGYVQENKAEQSLKKLQQMAALAATALRNGQHTSMHASELVPGDIILLEAGNVVPADARLMEVNGLKIEEATLTGESMPAEKQPEPLNDDDLVPADRTNMVFKGTSVSHGSAKAVVTATGMNTEIGKIAKMLEGESQKTPLQRKLNKFGKQMAAVVLVVCTIIFGIGWYKGEPVLQMFLTALSLAVAALPEALPAVITIALAKGAARMVKQHALIRRLPAVETLGAVTYICSDKTGTLTLNKMTVEQVKAADGKDELLQYAMLLNNEVKINDRGEYTGDPTEIAMVQYALEKGLNKEDTRAALPQEGLLPFDSERMVMTTLHRQRDKWLMLVKGAPLKIAEKLADKNGGEEWLKLNREWASQGLRVLFFAGKVLDQKPMLLKHDDEQGLELIGMVGMIDPPREEVIAAIKECHEAGIETVMITGDQPLTAKAIALKLNIISDEQEEPVTGADLLKKGHDLRQVVKNTRVYARVSPEQKLKIVTALQDNGEVAAMTGDGVNDAPSLKKADIGIAMGITGTDVSKTAAHMILLDDNFATIVKAVKEGRRIYSNIRKFIRYVLACNLGEILVILMAPFLSLPVPLLPIHILWINLVTDGLPGLAIANEPAGEGIMKQPPRPPDEPIFTAGFATNIILTGVALTAASLGAQQWAVVNGYNIVAQQTIVFTTLCFTQLGNALSVRSGSSFILHKFFHNWLLLGAIVLTMALQAALVFIPALNIIFKTTPLDTRAFIAVTVITTACTALVEGLKMLGFLLTKRKK